MHWMKAAAFTGRDRFREEDVPGSAFRAGEAALRIAAITVNGADVFFVRRVPRGGGLVIGHTP